MIDEKPKPGESMHANKVANWNTANFVTGRTKGGRRQAIQHAIFYQNQAKGALAWEKFDYTKTDVAPIDSPLVCIETTLYEPQPHDDRRGASLLNADKLNEQVRWLIPKPLLGVTLTYLDKFSGK